MEKRLDGERLHERCAYRDCSNGRFINSKHLFRFPSEKETQRLEAWLTNCGNPGLRKFTMNTIRRYGLCADHFESRNFTTPKQTKLKRDSVPVAYTVRLQSSTETDDPITEIPAKRMTLERDTKSSPRSSTKNETITLPIKIETLRITPPVSCPDNGSSSTEATAEFLSKVAKASVTDDVLASMSESKMDYKDREILRLKNKIRGLQKEVSVYRSESKRLRQKEKRFNTQRRRLINETLIQKKLRNSVRNILQKLDIKPAAKGLISLQLHTTKTMYTEEEKNVSILLNYHSPAALKSLKKTGCHFPAENSIRNWLSDYESNPGEIIQTETDATSTRTARISSQT